MGETTEKKTVCKGLPYAAINTRTPRAVQRLERKYGIVGYGIYCKLLVEISGENGYFMPWTDFDTETAAEEWAPEFPEILADALEWGIFNKECFEQLQILTNEDAVLHYLQAKKKSLEYIAPTISDILRQSPTFYERERESKGGTDISTDLTQITKRESEDRESAEGGRDNSGAIIRLSDHFEDCFGESAPETLKSIFVMALHEVGEEKIREAITEATWKTKKAEKACDYIKAALGFYK